MAELRVRAPSFAFECRRLTNTGPASVGRQPSITCLTETFERAARKLFFIIYQQLEIGWQQSQRGWHGARTVEQ
jgi:hypothetical protein